PGAARWMAALAGVRVVLSRDFSMPRDFPDRMRLSEALVRGGPGDPAADAARYGVSHLIVTPDFLSAYGVPLDELARRPYLSPVLFAGDARGEYVALFVVARRPS